MVCITRGQATGVDGHTAGSQRSRQRLHLRCRWHYDQAMTTRTAPPQLWRSGGGGDSARWLGSIPATLRAAHHNARHCGCPAKAAAPQEQASCLQHAGEAQTRALDGWRQLQTTVRRRRMMQEALQSFQGSQMCQMGCRRRRPQRHTGGSQANYLRPLNCGTAALAENPQLVTS